MDTETTTTSAPVALHPEPDGAGPVAVITVPAHVLTGLLRIAATDDVRYYLNGIYCEPDAGLLIATDGHALVAHRFGGERPAPGIGPFIIPRTLAKQGAALKARGMPGIIVTLDRATGAARKVTLAGAHGAVTAPEVDGKFPEWRRTVPTSPSGETTQFNPSLLARVHEALSEISTGHASTKPACVYLAHNGNGPALMTCGDPGVIGVVMPWRAPNDPTQETLEALGLVRTPKAVAA